MVRHAIMRTSEFAVQYLSGLYFLQVLYLADLCIMYINIKFNHV